MSDGAYCVQQTADGGYIIAGYTYSNITRSQDIWLVKMNAAGDTTWTRTFGDGFLNMGRVAQQTTDGGYIVAGLSGNFDASPVIVMLYKTDATGNPLWERIFYERQLEMDRAVQQTSDGGFIITGYVHPVETQIDDVFLVKTDAQGDTVWSRSYGSINTDQGSAVQQTSDGGYVIAGWTVSGRNTLTDALLIKTDAQGDTLWTKTYGGDSLDVGLSMQQTSDEGYIILGETRSYGQGDWDIWLIKTDSQGDTLWTSTFGGAGFDAGYSIQQTTDNGYIITGETESFGLGNSDVWLIKTDATGKEVWNRTYGGPYEEIGWSVRQTSDGGYIIAGQTRSFGSGFLDGWIIKTDENGNR